MKQHLSGHRGIAVVLAVTLLAVVLGGSGLAGAQTWTHERVDDWEI